VTANLAYVVSRFPLTTETFILREVMELTRLGWPIEMFSIRHTREPVVHDEARFLEPRVHYPGWQPVLAGNLGVLARRPHRWARLLAATIGGNACSPEFLAKSLVVFPIAVGWARQMQRLGVRHIHAHFGSYPALAALLAAESLGIGFSFTVHAHDLYADNVMLAEKVRRARFVATISEFNRQRLCALVDSDIGSRVHVVRCGVNVGTYDFTPRRPGSAPRSLLSVAALREYKGLAYLIRACALLRVTAPQESFICRIVGDGPERGALERLIRELKVEECVQLMGACEQHVVKDLLAEADTFVLPSVVARNGYMDGVPVALMEAMASGVPVIASHLSGIPELVRDRDTGLLVPPNEAEEIRDAILCCWREQEAAVRRAVRARALVEREYNLETNTRELARRYEHVLKSGPRPLGQSVRPFTPEAPTARSSVRMRLR
jgi:glycosyltransferase involved in cell wall biosynthesis